MQRAPAALTIAGSDSGGGAGIQADIKTFSALGVYGACALTAVTVQNTRGVFGASLLEAEIVAAQIGAVLDDIEIDAVKIGMLGASGLVDAVADALSPFQGPVVLDPVMVAKSGDALLAPDAVEALLKRLLPRADLVTPNLPEAARMLGRPVARDPGEAEAQGRALLDVGARGVLLKGGHGCGPTCVDVLVTPAGTRRIETPWISTRNTHGTGCSLSSAIAAELAKGAALEHAVRIGHAWLNGAIKAADRLGVGRGHGPVNHFHEVWR